MEVSSFLPFSYFNTLGIWFQDRGGCTVEDFCNHIHRSLVKEVKYVLVWGISARHYPQHCGLSHLLQDEDVVQIVKKKVQTIISLFNSLIETVFTWQLYMAALSLYLNRKLLIETPCKLNPTPKKKKVLKLNIAFAFSRIGKGKDEVGSSRIQQRLLEYLIGRKRLHWRHNSIDRCYNADLWFLIEVAWKIYFKIDRSIGSCCNLSCSSKSCPLEYTGWL